MICEAVPMEEVCGGIHYRYWLHRCVKRSGKEGLVFVLLNPSTATATEDDPTILSCIRRACSWGYRELTVVNLFAMRATDPQQMMAEGDLAIGERNDDALQWAARLPGRVVVAAWGDGGAHLDRANTVLPVISPAFAMKMTKKGQPRHPLYLSEKLQPDIPLQI